MTKSVSVLGEFGLIDLIAREGLSSSRAARVIRGIGDDAAVVPLSVSKYLLLTTDMLVEGVHFTRRMPAGAIGHKAMAANISDIAAMGGIPKHAVVSLGVPLACPAKFVSGIYRGLRRTARAFGVAVVGGDTVKSRCIVINVALTGEVGRRDVVYRRGARPGDRIFVTGPLGRSLKSGRHLRFIPRVEAAQYLLRKARPTAMIDVSDGLAADLGHILTASGVGAVLEEDAIPRRRGASLRAALNDGEDFELLFTIPPSRAAVLECPKRGLTPFDDTFYPIGEIVAKRHGLQLHTAQGRWRALEAKGYRHF